MDNKGTQPEAVLNAAGTVWDIDALVRPQNKSGNGDSDEACTGSDLILAVGTGLLRQTDDPVDEVRFE